MKIIYTIVLALVMVLGFAPSTTAQSTPDIYVYGIVRFPAAGPQVLDDANHTPKGVTGAYINSGGYLVIEHTNLINVGGSTMDSDETLMGRGITCGVSQGFDKATIRCFDAKLNRALDLDVASDYDRIEGTNANVFYSGWSSGH